MKTVLLEIPDVLQTWMEERARLGHDRFDEMWEGVLHMVPPPGGHHQERNGQLVVLLHPLAAARGLRIAQEIGVFHPSRTDSYRVPDLSIYSAEVLSDRGVEGRAELVIELRSPGDESWEKMPFFAECAIPEVLIIEPAEAALLRLRGDGSGYDRVAADSEGFVETRAVPAAFRVLEAGVLEVRAPNGTTRV